MSTARDFGDVKRAAIALLKATVTSAKDVQPYTGQLEDVLQGVVKGLPLLTVGYSGGTFEQLDGPNYYAPMTFEVGIFAHTQRSAAALDEMSEDLLRAVRDCLINVRLAENVNLVVPIEDQLVFSSSDTQIYGFRFSVSMDQEYQWPE